MAAAMTVAASAVSCSAPAVFESGTDDSSAAVSAVSDDTSETSATLEADSLSNTLKTSDSELFSKRDLDPSYTEVTTAITLSGDTASADGQGVQISGSSVTITQEGIYLISGTLNDGQIIVNADKAKVQLVLDGADITSKTSSAILGTDSDKIFITLAEGSKNTLTGGNADSETPACIFSSDSITFNGSGSLTVNSDADGIRSKDDIVITGGNITVNAAADGIKGKDYIAAAGGNITVNAGEDGIKSTNAVDEGMGFIYIEDGTFVIESGNDGIQAETDLNISGGDFTVTSGGGSSESAKTHSDFGFGGGGFGRGDFDPSQFEGITPPDFGGDFDPSQFDGMTPPDFGGNSGADGRSGATEKKRSDSDSGTDSGSELSVTNISALSLAAEDTSADEDTVSDSTKGLKGGTSINISGGSFSVNSADDAIHSNGDLTISGGVFTLDAGDDGIHSEGTVNIGEKAENTFDNVQIFISNCYEGIEGVTINQNSGTVYIISGDDGYNAAGGELDTSSGTNNFGRGEMMSTSTGTLNINGGLAVVNSANGDHDAFDSNGDTNLNGGYICANGQEPFDCGDTGSTINYNGTSIITMTAGNTDLTQRYSFVDSDGNIIVSFMSAKGSAGQNCTDCTAQSGGSVSGGTEILTQAEGYSVYTGGKLTGAEKITAEAQSGSMFGGGFGGGFGERRGNMEIPTDENGEVQMPQGGFGGRRGNTELPTDENGEVQMPDGSSGGNRRNSESSDSSGNYVTSSFFI